MQTGFIEDLVKRLLYSEKIDLEEGLIIFDCLKKKYSKYLSDGKERTNDEQDESIEKVIKSLSKYTKYFDNNNFSKCLEEYKSHLGEGVELDENDIISSISDMADKLVLMQAELGKFSRNSGVNIINDKTNYTNNIKDFEFAREKFTPDFIKQTIMAMGNVTPEMANQYKQKYEYLCKNLAESAIKDKVDYYGRTVDYLVDFYADNEIARREEQQLA